MHSTNATKPLGWVAINDLLPELFHFLRDEPDWKGVKPPEGLTSWSELFPLDENEKCKDADEDSVKWFLETIGRKLASGTLLSAGIDLHTGKLIYVGPESWRVLIWDEESKNWSSPIFIAWNGQPIEYGEERYNRPLCHPILTERSLCEFFGANEIWDWPTELPSGWPETPSRRATDEQLEWFSLGYAVRARDMGKCATRDELRDAVVREAVSGAREAEAAHKALPAKLKNADRSKGGRGAAG